ncbi:MAG: hypothetical protein A2W91_07280 [Bacteroidetes bacterium GWF2_38_335]|nr:MAG: hypothetical protein A2W91_07280 [Bacteroidetes bacterium GWF2_38_335]OFY77130.1 MAG: hypothetical protein A2281_14515 [Bacteroidetes bacterium RIFOXYA12_FULL_38_20]HBS85021.1 glycosyl transferase [Bacteroidales bacterium]
MKIAIAGTRGIPNQYGGFEQFAEKLSVLLVANGHEVLVYNPNYHPYKEQYFEGVKIIRKTCHEKILKGAAHFYYDYICIKHAIKERCDAVIVCGYGTSAFALKYLNRKETEIIVNMDGMEWKRKKYHSISKHILMKSEKIAVKIADVLIADHPGIKEYLFSSYNKEAIYIPYGADIPVGFSSEILQKFKLEEDNYFLTVARDDPDNQIDTIIRAWSNSNSDRKLVVISNKKINSKNTNANANLVFIEGLYDYQKLADLRQYSSACIHGHSVGGTNPSLLETMAAGALIIAHRNEFNKGVLGENAFYFSDIDDLSKVFKGIDIVNPDRDIWKQMNLEKIKKEYDWIKIAEKYLGVIEGG